MGNRIFKILILLLSVLLCITMTSCLSLLQTIELVYNNALDTPAIENREFAYGDRNDLSVNFENGKMYATWDSVAGRTYKLIIKTGDTSVSVDSASPYYKEGKINLSALGFDFNRKFTLLLDETQLLINGKKTDRTRFDFKGLTPEIYDKYTKLVKGGFKNMDYYISSRSEWFDFWSYLVIFREGYKYSDGVYEVNCKVYMGYDYESLYSTSNVKEAFAYEVYSAIDAYEDSAAYSYTYSVSDDGREGSIYMKFLYDFDPKYATKSTKSYENASEKSDVPHYEISPESYERSFPIDEITDTISVSSSDQLYYAMKKGYKPLPVPGSNADLLYNEMRKILSTIIQDTDSKVDKVHKIYDYIVDTVIYDYEFANNVYENNSVSISQLFGYRCLYMEGVFGLGPKNVFSENERVAICDGLSKAFLCMATIEGIDCIKISGTVNGDGHAWNKVNIDSVWYMVDTTWGNSLEKETNKEFLSHGYLLVPDDSKHTESKYITYPKASTRYKFGNINNNPNSDEVPFWRYPFYHGNPRFSA